MGNAHKEAWIAFYVAHVTLTKEIDRRMEAAGVVPLDVYEVLLALEESDGNCMRMSQLAEAIFLSKSGLTRLVDRLEKEGLLTRRACSHDRRAQYAVLTERGIAERDRAWPVYKLGIQELFASKMTEEEANLLVGVLRRMTGNARCYGSSLPCGQPGP